MKGRLGSKKERKPTERKQCISWCKSEKPVSQFYLSNSQFHVDNRYPVCKACLKKDLDTNNIEQVKDLLMQMNRPYLDYLWRSTIEESNRSGKDDLLGMYLKNVQLNYKDLTWKDSVLKNSEVEEKSDYKAEGNIIIENPSNYLLSELKKKYGHGYPDEEYYLFEEKYQQLKTSFQLLTTMHEEYFREFCVNKVKETLAKARGDFKEAKEWAAMVKDVAEAGKLKPSQMSKADLSGGLDGFGQLARMVEENCELMPILPMFTEQPKDKVDVTLWCFINYVRDLKGLPECEYRDIYEFYEKRKQEYEKQMLDNTFVSEEDDLDG